MHTRLAFLYQWLISVAFISIVLPATAQDGATPQVVFSKKEGFFPLVSNGQTAGIYTESGTASVVTIAANALGQDIQDITGILPAVNNNQSSPYAVIIGTIGNGGWIDSLAKQGKLATASIAGKWESYSISVVDRPLDRTQALVIAGSDARGTAFGVFDLCRRMGVSPWTWWADVHPAPHKEIYVSPGSLLQGPPSVKYRGIFLNDEDWGLQPWAAHKMDPEVKDIGPHTYARIFELLLRLRANYIWPAMHPCTKAFYYYPDNPRLANAYGIVVGSSHCEPMLRNNVFEWTENYAHEYGNAPGEWRYDRNRTQIYDYWKDRVRQSGHYESVYTVGMRGIHDGSMPGPPSVTEKVKLLQEVIDDQRRLLGTGMDKPVQNIPQIFCPYKEVLTLYRNGLSLPDDVTIVWADDNHGYIRQLSSEQEQKRSGRSGVYYHLSYWGAPHDYLWLSSVSPSLTSYEMTKAWQLGADRLWVFNVGDIKPAELETEFAMDLAWNVQQWPPAKINQYIRSWAARTFGETYADTITDIKKTYYLLAQSGKPEHMASIRFTEDEADARLAQYQAIADKAQALYGQMPVYLKDAFYELILYPVKGACHMNEKILYAQKSLQFAASGHPAALVYASKAQNAFAMIKQMTAYYNDSIAGGKWNGIMSWHPRNLPVFNMPPVGTQQMIDSAIAAQDSTAVAMPNTFQQFIPAAAYTRKQEPAGASFQTIEGLGAGGNGVTIFPFITAGIDLAHTPWLEYKVRCGAGAHTVLVKCLPTQSIGSNGLLRYAISVNGETPHFVNIHTESESRVWKENVLRGFALGKSSYTLAEPGTATIRIWFPDPGLVINQLEIE